jgi:hypothetical protein
MPINPWLARAGERIERRMFLKAAAAGLSVAAAGRIARVATAAPSAAPRRFLLMYMPHGVAPEHYNPRVAAGDPTSFDLDKTNVSILGPLQAYRSYVNVYQGFQYIGLGATHEGIVNCLSGATPADTTTPRTTVEQVIAKGLGARPLILGACSHIPYGMDNHGMLFWDGTPIDPQKSPVQAADTLFGAPGGGTSPAVNADVQLRKDLLALTASEIQDLQTTLGGLTTEQTRLAAHLAAIENMEAAGAAVAHSTCSSRPDLPTVEMVRSASAGLVVDPSGGNDYFYQEKNFPLLLQAQMEVITQALICNAAQVIGLMPMYATCDFDFTFAGAPGAHHLGLSHTNVQAAAGAMYNSPISVDNYDATARAPFATAQRWFIQQLVTNIVSVLATTDDPAAPGTKVLDNTLIYLMSEIGDGFEHNRTSEVDYPQVPSHLPLVTIGKAGGGLKSGQVVSFPIDVAKNAGTVDRPATDLYLTLCQAMGVSGASFPGTTGAITEVLP